MNRRAFLAAIGVSSVATGLLVAGARPGYVEGLKVEPEKPITELPTEGLWWWKVTAKDHNGDSTISIGDALYVNDSTGIVSKDSTDRHIGYAIFGDGLCYVPPETVAAGSTRVIAILMKGNQ